MDFVWVIWVVWSIHIERLTIQYFVKISVSKRVFQVLVLPHPKGVMVMIEIEDADVFKLLFWRRLVSAGRLHHLALKVIYLTTHQPHQQCNAMQGNSRDQSPVCTEGYFSQRPKATLFFFRIHSCIHKIIIIILTDMVLQWEGVFTKRHNLPAGWGDKLW